MYPGRRTSRPPFAWPLAAAALALVGVAIAYGSSGAHAGPRADPLVSLLKGGDRTEVVAQAGGFDVTRGELDAELAAVPPRARPRYDNDNGREDLRNRVLLRHALFADAVAAGVLDRPEAAHLVRKAAMDAVVTLHLGTIEEEAIGDELVETHYRDNGDQYAKAEVRARHILVDSRDEALILIGRLRAGEDFGELAKAHSTDRGSKGKGGELPWGPRDRWAEGFGDAAFTLPVGQLSEPVETKFGFHLIEVLERRDHQPLEEVRPGIERKLAREAVKAHRDRVKRKLGLD